MGNFYIRNFNRLNQSALLHEGIFLKFNLMQPGMRFLVLFTLLIPGAFSYGQQSRNKDEIRMSIYFGGGSYYIDEAHVTALYHWLDSVPA